MGTVNVKELVDYERSSLDDSEAFKQKLSKVKEQLNEKVNSYELLQNKIFEVQQKRQRNQVGELEEIVLVNESIKLKIDQCHNMWKKASTKFNEFEQQKSMLLYYVEKLNTWL